MLAYSGSTHFEVTTFIKSATSNRIVHVFFHGDAFAGDGSFIKSTTAFNNYTVYWNGCTGFYDKDIASDNFFHRNLALQTVSFYKGNFGGKVHQLGNSFTGTIFGTSFHKFTQGNEG